MEEEQWTVDICQYMEHRFSDDLLLDIRDRFMYDHGTLPGAVHFPADQLGKLYELPRDRTICVFCQAGEVSGEIMELLRDAGYRAYDLAGGYREYLRNEIRINKDLQENQ